MVKLTDGTGYWVLLQRLGVGQQCYSSLRYWVIHSITHPSLFLAGWLFVSTGLASEFGRLDDSISSGFLALTGDIGCDGHVGAEDRSE